MSVFYREKPDWNNPITGGISRGQVFIRLQA